MIDGAIRQLIEAETAIDERLNALARAGVMMEIDTDPLIDAILTLLGVPADVDPCASCLGDFIEGQCGACDKTGYSRMWAYVMYDEMRGLPETFIAAARERMVQA